MADNSPGTFEYGRLTCVSKIRDAQNRIGRLMGTWPEHRKLLGLVLDHLSEAEQIIDKLEEK